MGWLNDFSAAAQQTDRLVNEPNHVELLAAGLLGEAGGILSESKKEARERNAYPAYRKKMQEEIGDFLWYFVRLVTVVKQDLLIQIDKRLSNQMNSTSKENFQAPYLVLGSVVGSILEKLENKTPQEWEDSFELVWSTIEYVASSEIISLKEAADDNILKTKSRWPDNHNYKDFFDNNYFEEEQLPRKLTIEFRERSSPNHPVVILRCNGINFGDRLTDNIKDPDGYRYHDIFHFANAVYLGWSPVVRALLRCKRKSIPKVDVTQDGLRAAVLEEGVTTLIFSRAKNLGFFDGKNSVDYGLLKMVQELVSGYEVASIPLWQWEIAILEGFRIFRALKTNKGGLVTLDFENRKLDYRAPTP